MCILLKASNLYDFAFAEPDGWFPASVVMEFDLGDGMRFAWCGDVAIRDAKPTPTVYEPRALWRLSYQGPLGMVGGIVLASIVSVTLVSFRF